MDIARVSILALVALAGCVGSTGTEGIVAALECGDGQVCPDGSLCSDDGRCAIPDDGNCECAADADPELCAELLVRCEEGDPNDRAEPDEVCDALVGWCEEGDEAACEVFARHCEGAVDPGECPCDCPDGADNGDCRCECEPPPGGCEELAALCERGEQDACERFEQECRDPAVCPCDCPDGAGNEDCRCECDPEPLDPCAELAAACERGDAQSCEAWEWECFDDGDPEPCPCDCAADGQENVDCRCDCDPAGGDRCAELGAACEQGDAQACEAWEWECADANRP